LLLIFNINYFSFEPIIFAYSEIIIISELHLESSILFLKLINLGKLLLIDACLRRAAADWAALWQNWL